LFPPYFRAVAPQARFTHDEICTTLALLGWLQIMTLISLALDHQIIEAISVWRIDAEDLLTQAKTWGAQGLGSAL
jgi:hypothetical protein